MTTIKNELIGTWKLLSYIELPIDGGDSCFPLGQSPKGILLFHPDGYMSVQISTSDDVRYVSNDKLGATDEEFVARIKGYIAFSGKYKVNNFTGCVEYAILTSLFPNWEGTKQIRKIDFEGDVLYQKSTESVLSQGRKVYAYMTWKRIEKDEVDDVLFADSTHFGLK